LEGTFVEDDDFDETFGSLMEITLRSQHGRFFVEGSGISVRFAENKTSGSQEVVFRGSLAAINEALRKAKYQGQQHYFGTDLIEVLANDLGFTGIGGPQIDNQSIPITLEPVNDAPIINVASRLSRVYEDYKILLPSIQITDPDWDAARKYYGNQIFNCTRDDEVCYNSSFWRDRSSPAYAHGAQQVEISAEHGRLMLASAIGLGFGRLFPVNQTRNQYNSPLDLGDAWIQDQIGYSTVSLADFMLGEKVAAGIWFENVTFWGRLDNVNAALSAVTYWPDRNWNSWAGQDLERIKITVTDYAYGSVQIVQQEFYVEVIALNDPPLLTVPGVTRDPWLAEDDGLNLIIRHISPIVIQEDETLSISGISVRDVDINELSTGLLTLSIEGVHGTISVSFHPSSGGTKSSLETSALGRDLSGMDVLTGTGQRDQKLVLRGPIDTVNTLLESLKFQPEQDYYGSGASVILTVDDGGASGSEDPLVIWRSQQIIPIDVRAINDPPVITIPTMEDGSNEQYVDENQEVRLVGTHYSGLNHLNFSTLGFSSSAGFELWRSEVVRSSQDQGDWGAGDLEWRYHLVKDIFKGQDSSSPRFFCTYNRLLYFQATDPVHGAELWRTDGTQAGTVMVKDIFPGAQGSAPSHLVVFNGYLYFQAEGIDLSWMLPPHLTDQCGGFRQSRFDDRVFYAVSGSTTWDTTKTYDCPYGYHWANTEEAYHIFTGPEGEDGTDIDRFTYFDQCGWQGFDFGSNTRKYFRFRDSSTTGAYKHAGKRDSRRPDVDRYGIVTVDFAGIVCVVGESPLLPDSRWEDCKYGQATDNCKTRLGKQLWRTDGTPEGTQRMDDVRTSLKTSSDAAPAYLMPYNGALYFQGYSDDYGLELFRSTGITGGTELVKDIRKGHQGSSPSFLTVCNNLLFFTADDGIHGNELWVSDGNLGYFGDMVSEGFLSTGGKGTTMVIDLNMGSASSTPRFLTPSSNSFLLYFQADDGVHGRELWVSDGTKTGTRMVADIFVGNHGSNPSHLLAHGALLYFQADDGMYGAELWVTDGTSQGTRMVMDIRPGSLSSYPSYLTTWDTSIVFIATDGYGTGSSQQREGSGGSQLWITDGTTISTRKAFPQTQNYLYMDFVALDAMFPARLPVYQNTLYLSASKGLAQEVAVKQGLTWQNEAFVTGIDQALVVTDVDQEPDAQMSIAMSCQKCILTMMNTTGLTVTNVFQAGATSSWVANGTILAINRAMRDLHYQSLPTFIGWDTVSIKVRDSLAYCYNSTSEDGQTLCDSSVVPSEVESEIKIYITPINSPPNITVTQTSFLGSITDVIVIKGVAVDDPDVNDARITDVYGVGHDAALTVRLHSLYGRLSLQSRDKISFMVGDGEKDRELFFHGPLTAVNKALSQIEYSFYAGDYDDPSQFLQDGYDDTISILVDDNGHSGRGGPLTDSVQLQVTVVGTDTT